MSLRFGDTGVFSMDQMATATVLWVFIILVTHAVPPMWGNLLLASVPKYAFRNREFVLGSVAKVGNQTTVNENKTHPRLAMRRPINQLLIRE